MQRVDIKRLKSKQQKKYGVVGYDNKCMSFHVRTGACSMLTAVMHVCVCGCSDFPQHACMSEGILKGLEYLIHQSSSEYEVGEVRKVLVI